MNRVQLNSTGVKAVVTGALGFIGCNLVETLLYRYPNIQIMGVDDLSGRKIKNKLSESEKVNYLDRTDFIESINNNENLNVDVIFHLGARTDTSEKDTKVFDALNVSYSKSLFKYCASLNIPFLYASSAAVYGNGKQGFSDDHSKMDMYSALNPYGKSKLDIDQWIIDQNSSPVQWNGFRFFNVYGPLEYHKSRMASVVFHAFNQIKKTGEMKLFRSHRSDFKDGQQSRDFIYVKDVVNTLIRAWVEKLPSGVYNLGTGKSRTFYDLVKGVFKALELPVKIKYIDIPEDIRSSYQYFTEAPMEKLSNHQKDIIFTSLEDGIEDYVRCHLNIDL